MQFAEVVHILLFSLMTTAHLGQALVVGECTLAEKKPNQTCERFADATVLERASVCVPRGNSSTRPLPRWDGKGESDAHVRVVEGKFILRGSAGRIR